jgi:hypothetical protein
MKRAVHKKREKRKKGGHHVIAHTKPDSQKDPSAHEGAPAYYGPDRTVHTH